MWRTMLYHRTDPPRIVESQIECDRLLAEGWAETPAAFYDPPPGFYDAPDPPADATSAPRRTRKTK